MTPVPRVHLSLQYFLEVNRLSIPSYNVGRKWKVFVENFIWYKYKFYKATVDSVYSTKTEILKL